MSGGSSVACALILSTVAATVSLPFAMRRTAHSWILRPSRSTSVSTVSSATGTGRIKSMVTRAIRIGTGVAIRSAAHTASDAGAPPCCMLGSQGPAAWGLVTTLAPSTRKMASIDEASFAARQIQDASARGRERRFEPVGELDVDLESRNILAPFHPDNNLVGIERNVAGYRCEDFLAQTREQVRLLAEQPALMRQQYLQPFARDGGGGRGGTAEQPKQFHAHAALRPSRRFIRPMRSAGTDIAIVSPSRRRVASR